MKNLLAISAMALLAVSRPVTAAESLQIVVMDPLSKEIACACVKGYAQRNYKVLAAFLQQKLGVEVKIAHGENLATALKESGGAADLIIGKSSVVLCEARNHKLDVAPVARLTDKLGSPYQQGWIVVRKETAATKLSDIAGWRIIFGPEDCDEKSAAPIALLKDAGVAIPDKLETAPSCSAAAEALMKLAPDAKAAAVISSYAEPLLSGCGTVKAGDLRVIGKSKDVPFITAFANKTLSKERLKALTEALLDTGANPQLLQAIESSIGFIELEETAAPKKTGALTPWDQFRGANRNGTVDWLPVTLPKTAEFAWKTPLPSDGIGGIAATEEVVIVSGRDALDESDVFFSSMPAPVASARGFNTPRESVTR